MDDSLDDLIVRLGGVSPDRIRWHPTPGTATVADLEQAKLCELIDGTLVEKAGTFQASVVNLGIGSLISGWVRRHNLGVTTGATGGLQLRPGLVRKPGVAYVSWDRFPGRRRPDGVAYPAVAPDLAVEVLSPTNTPGEMGRKRGEYFAAGTVLVWEVDPDARTVAVYTAPTGPRVLAVGDVLDGGPVLPGFALTLADLFAELDRHG